MSTSLRKIISEAIVQIDVVPVARRDWFDVVNCDTRVLVWGVTAWYLEAAEWRFPLGSSMVRGRYGMVQVTGLRWHVGGMVWYTSDFTWTQRHAKGQSPSYPKHARLTDFLYAPRPCQQPVNITHDYTVCCLYRVDPPDDKQQVCSKHVEAYYWNKLIENSASCWFILYGYSGIYIS